MVDARTQINRHEAWSYPWWRLVLCFEGQPQKALPSAVQSFGVVATVIWLGRACYELQPWQLLTKNIAHSVLCRFAAIDRYINGLMETTLYKSLQTLSSIQLFSIPPLYWVDRKAEGGVNYGLWTFVGSGNIPPHAALSYVWGSPLPQGFELV